MNIIITLNLTLPRQYESNTLILYDFYKSNGLMEQWNAIEYDERKKVSVINEALCKGCGSCSGFCPSSAAQIRHFKDKQIFSELEGILDALHQVGM